MGNCNINCYVIYDNYNVQFVIVGTEKLATNKLKELKLDCERRCIRDYGPTNGAREFDKHYWHLKSSDCEISFYSC